MTLASIEAAGAAAQTAGSHDGRYRALDSLRGIAACWVVIFHLPSDGHSWPLPIIQNGFLAVTFFFILSGFVIGASYGNRLSGGYPIGKFMFLRWGRIYPLHAFMLLVLFLYELVRLALGLGAFREGTPFTGLTALPDLFWNLALLQEVPAALSWNKPSWSIGVEFWTYLVCAGLLHLLRSRLLFAAICMMVPGTIFVLFGPKLGLSFPTEIESLLKCALGFGLGLAIYDARQRRWPLPPQGMRGLAATAFEAVAVLFLLAAAWTFGGKTSHLIYPAFAATIWVFSFEAGHLSKLLLTRPMLLLGMLSYSIYMVHQFIQDRLLDLIAASSGLLPLIVTQSGRIVLAGDPLLCDAATAIMLAMVITASWCTYQFIEEPARQWSRRIAAKFGPRLAQN